MAGLEFYLSKELVLYREVSINEASANDDGGLIVQKGERRERLVFRKGTPGRLTHNGGDKIGITFEGSHERFLLFGSKSIKGNYYLLADEWHNGQGELRYGDDHWFTAPGSGEIYLILKAEKKPTHASYSKIIGGL